MRYIALFSLLFLLVGCASRPTPLPDQYSQKLPWGAIDLDINSTEHCSIKNSLGKVLTQKAQKYSDVNGSVPMDILALTGGGSRGAFGTGLLVGWTKRGTIPNFDIVTGVSTGAVMAPFVFLGKEELKKVEYFYTKMHTEEVFTSSLLHIFGYGYVMNAKPLKKLFKENFNKEFLDKIAQEHKKGRRLYIGTTNIDTGQLTVWDMGAIASSNRADKYKRFRDVIYASTALPIYLPPEYIAVDVEEKQYYQMHVDGGIYTQVFMIGLLVNWGEVLEFEEHANTNFDATLYTVANRKYRQRDIYKPIEQAPLSIIEAYVLTEMDLLFDRSMYRLYHSSQQKDINFKMATIPEKMPDIIDVPTEFDPTKMTKLFNFGYKTGYEGVQWREKIDFNEYDNHQ
ncbi:MAG: patatin-like phospholipase family protein [Campylobacterota bacterium]|nr:patatin-like phospholipase family protein [Campylobacterota bacterium]